jgi:hypothetical protein
MPSFAAPFFTWFRPGKLSNFVLGWVVPLLNKLGGLPKEKNIVLPSPENLIRLGLPKDMSYKGYVAWVQKSAKKNLSGHRFSMWYSELGDMIEMGQRGLPFAALEGIRVVYMICKRNDTVDQPEAFNVWAAGVLGMTSLWVDSTHCGFTESFDGFAYAFKETLV